MPTGVYKRVKKRGGWKNPPRSIEYRKKIGENNRKRTISNKTKDKIRNFMKTQKGKLNHNYKGDRAGYFALHLFIKNKYGKANKCYNRENKILNFTCSGISKVYQWAKIKGHEYTRSDKDYHQLCRSCHARYDYIKKIK
jgi:hypothetical protein